MISERGGGKNMIFNVARPGFESLPGAADRIIILYKLKIKY